MYKNAEKMQNKREGKGEEKRMGWTMQTGRQKLKVKEVERAIGCIFMLWSVSIDRDERRENMRLPCPLGQFPWKRNFSPLHIYCMFILVALYSQQ